MKSRYVVLTGAPCSGKTTTIERLNRSGYISVNEKATEVISDGIDPRTDPIRFRTEVLNRQMEAEQDRMTSPSSVFLDRGSLDGIAYCTVTNDRVPGPFHRVELAQNYAVVLLFDPLPFWENDGVRYEDASFASQITPALECAYRSAGVPVHRIPVMPEGERVQYIYDVLACEGIQAPAYNMAA